MYGIAHVRPDPGDSGKARAQAAIPDLRKQGLVIIPCHQHVGLFIGADGMVVRAQPPEVHAEVEAQEQ